MFIQHTIYAQAALVSYASTQVRRARIQESDTIDMRPYKLKLKLQLW